jgi:Ca2+-binding RTX toxin-like protein
VTGGGGKDVLIGGNGADRLIGGIGDDLLLGGRTVHDDTPAALSAVHREWSGRASYAARVQHLLGAVPGGLNGVVLLDPAGLMDDESVADELTGGTGLDWYLRFAPDTVTDAAAGETVTTH